MSTSCEIDPECKASMCEIDLECEASMCEIDLECKESMCEIDLERKEGMCNQDTHPSDDDFGSIWEDFFQDCIQTTEQDSEMSERILRVLENYQSKSVRIPEAVRSDTVDCVQDTSLPEPDEQTVGFFGDFYGGSL